MMCTGSQRQRKHLCVGVGRRWPQRRLQLRRLRRQYVDRVHQLSHQRRPHRRLRRVLFLHSCLHLQQRQELVARRRRGKCPLFYWQSSAKTLRVTQCWVKAPVQYQEHGVGIARIVEYRSRDRKDESSNPGRSGGRNFFSRVLFRCQFHPRVSAVARKRLL